MAHKGASRHAPEHTTHAYDLAVRQGASSLEADVRMTKDGALVCIHDSTVDRTSDGHAPVGALTLDELRKLDWGGWFNAAHPARARPEFDGVGLLALEELVDRYGSLSPQTGFHIEMKDPSPLEGRMESAIVQVLADPKLLDGPDDEPHKVSILCFDLKPLERIKRMAPALQTVYLFSRWRPELHAARRRPDYVDAIGPASRFLARNPRLLQWAQELELPVHTWTVNDPIEVKSWCNAGVDGIITDDPGLVRRVRCSRLRK